MKKPAQFTIDQISECLFHLKKIGTERSRTADNAEKILFGHTLEAEVRDSVGYDAFVQKMLALDAQGIDLKDKNQVAMLRAEFSTIASHVIEAEEKYKVTKSAGDRWNTVHSAASKKTKANRVLLVDEYAHALPQDKSSVIMDLGCGKGKDTMRLLEQGFQNLISVDISQYALEDLIQKLQQSGFSLHNRNNGTSQTFKRGEQDCTVMQSLLMDAMGHIKDSKIDTIVAAGSLQFDNHKDTQALMRELRRILKPQGKLIASVFSTRDTNEQFNQKPQLLKYLQHAGRSIQSRKLDPGYNTFNTRANDELQEMTRYYDEIDCKKYFSIIGPYEFKRPTAPIQLRSGKTSHIITGVVTNDKTKLVKMMT